MSNFTTDLEHQTKQYADARQQLKDTVSDLQQKIKDLQAEYIDDIKAGAKKVAQEQALLSDFIESNPQHFIKPRSQTLHSIKVGLRKLPGKLSSTNSKQAIKLIEQHYPAEIDKCIKVEKKLVKAGFQSWTVAMLKKCGISITADTDIPLVKPVDDSLDGFVSTLIKSFRNEQ